MILTAPQSVLTLVLCQLVECVIAHFTDEVTGLRTTYMAQSYRPTFSFCEVGADAGLALSSCSGQEGVGLLWFGLLPEGRQPCLPFLYMTFKKYHLINRLCARSPRPTVSGHSLCVHICQ